MKNFFQKNIHTSGQGFTLVEFIVIMSIFAIMVGVVMFNFSGFRSSVTMENLAQDIALSIRQIQVSAGASQSVGTPDDEVSRGIMFVQSTAGFSFEKEFILFQDDDGDGFYTDSNDTLIDRVSIQTNDVISSIEQGIDSSCLESFSINSDVSILFKRYDTAANFSFAGGRPGDIGCIKINITSSDGEKTRSVVVSRIGQVSVQ
jgi:Tfp pilus assembly protein FimT